ncbi:hypothetical protein K503DRAFT_802929 [Rhizopogon vinicolor AM-OR11-026]|uniref:Uncharacterized protein n=1 Tax=Rhizopogon vinicolor AM-OR11-026 TaxID=1314800 RepID=A0A1B7MRT3_9AGAM|nr:hypothetical protein K503DRAFT_802929 [Rhizopogon vinicolor AM-OR11-026]
MSSTDYAPQPVQMNLNAYSSPPRRVPRTRSYDQSSGCNVASRRQGASSLQKHAPCPLETSPTPPLSDLSPASTYSGLSWSGSSNTQEHSSPVTPEFPYVAYPNGTPITEFLSEFYDPYHDSNPDSGANRLMKLAGDDIRRLDLVGERDGKSMRNERLPELPVSCVADDAGPSFPDEVDLTKSLTSMPSGLGSWHAPVDVRKSRRFCRDFGELSRSHDHTLIRNEFPIHLAKDLPVTHSTSSPSFPPKHHPLRPPSRSEVCKLFSEEETATVREFLRIWGSNNRVKVPRSKPAPNEDAAPDGDGDYSWEAETEDSVWDPTPCSALLHEVGQMVGLPLEQPTMGDQSSISSTPPGLGTPSRLAQDDPGISQGLDSSFPSSYQSAALIRGPRILSDSGGADVGERTSSGVGQHVDQPLDVAPRASLTYGLLAENNTSIRQEKGESVTSKPMDVPIVLASSLDAASPVDSSHDLFLHRQLSPGRARSTEGDLRRRGQIFNVEKTRIPATSSGPVAVNEDRSYVPTREPPPLPPPLPVLPAKRVSALDRLEFSLSRLKAHASHQRKPSIMEKTNVRGYASSEAREPPLSTASRERKHQSGVTARLPHPRSAHGRHFSSPMLDGVPERPEAPRVETDRVNTHLQERAAKLFPYPENQELTMRSFMEMDVAPPKAQPPRRTSKLGRVAARLSQGIASFGKNFTGSRSIKECA